MIRRPGKQLVSLGSGLKDLMMFPVSTRRIAGHALRLVQQSKHYKDTRPMHDFGSAEVLKIPVDHITCAGPRTSDSAGTATEGTRR